MDTLTATQRRALQQLTILGGWRTPRQVGTNRATMQVLYRRGLVERQKVDTSGLHNPDITSRYRTKQTLGIDEGGHSHG